jgi:hypothetical protein
MPILGAEIMKAIFQNVGTYKGGSNLKVQHQITSTYLLQKLFQKVKKQYILMFISPYCPCQHSDIYPTILHV